MAEEKVTKKTTAKKSAKAPVAKKTEKVEKPAEKTEQKTKRTGLIIGIVAAIVVVVGVIVGVLLMTSGNKKVSAGTYEMTAMSENGQDMTSTVESLKAFGLTATMTIKDDGTGTLSLFGTDYSLTWDDKTVTYGGQAVEYKFDGKTITFGNDETSLTFTLKD